MCISHRSTAANAQYPEGTEWHEGWFPVIFKAKCTSTIIYVCREQYHLIYE